MLHLEYIFGRILGLTASPPVQLAWARRLAARGADQPALRLLVSAAKAGLPAAAHDLGCAYLQGRGVPPSLTEALIWLNQAAAADVPSAQSLLARMALEGITLAGPKGFFELPAPAHRAPDYPLALHWAQRAAGGGSAEGQGLLAFIRSAGPEEMRDPLEGERLYQAAAEAGNAHGELGWAMALLGRNSLEAARQARTLLHSAANAGLPTAHYLLGAIAESGMAGEADLVAAAEHYRDAAEQGHVAAQFRFGMALLAGRGVQPDPFEAESWLRRAALAGECAAAAVVGDLYATPGGLPPNYTEAAAWFRRAAEAGHAGSARTLARLMLRGVGVSADAEEGVHWLRQAIAHGDAEARADLAGLALARRVPEADQEATFQWFRERADADDPAAACNLGICLAEGIGAARDDAAALAMFRRAADSVPLAQYWCGRMLAEGRGAAIDPVAARACFLRAAEQHNADAEVAAGEMLINGRGGPPDHPRAMALFEHAAAAGHPAALYALKVLHRNERDSAVAA
jgi:uncharacterized protein